MTTLKKRPPYVVNAHKNVSETTILMTVENLIEKAVGPPEKNFVDYKMIQTVLHILARQVHMLETKVEIRIDEVNVKKDSSKPSTASSNKIEEIIEGVKTKKKRAASKERVKEDRTKLKDQLKVDKMEEKERLLDAQKAATNEKVMKEKNSLKPELKNLEENEKEQKELQKMLPIEKEKYLKENGERESEKKSHKEKEQYLKDKESEIKKMKKITPTERAEMEQYLKEKEEEMMIKVSPKEREKYLKDNEIETRETNKITPEKEEQYIKEKEKIEIEETSRKEREKYHKHKEIEKEEMEFMSPEEKEEYLKDKEKEERAMKRHRTASGTSTVITDSRRVSSIEVVTLPKFKMLEDVVMELMEKARPLPTPTLPDSKKLRSDLAKGTASLSDTIEVMQMSARVQAAEQAIDRMAGLFTQLAVAGALPEKFAKQHKNIMANMEAFQADEGSQFQSIECRTSDSGARSTPGITPDLMDQAMLTLKEDLTNIANLMTKRATTTAEMACGTAQMAAKNLDVALNLNNRIDTLHGITTDYVAQLAGFNAGFTTQIYNFKEQVVEMKAAIERGLVRFAEVKNNAENTFLLELKGLCNNVSLNLDRALMELKNLKQIQSKLLSDLHNLVKTMKMLEEEKADREELLDRIRDKIDISRLQGLVTTGDFKYAREDLEMELEDCYAKFSKLEASWMSAIKDLMTRVDSKADIILLQVVKDNVQEGLHLIQEKLDQLTIQLGDSEVAKLMRRLSKGGHCASCRATALMNPQDVNYGQPCPLPALHSSPEGEPRVQWFPRAPTDLKERFCHRWVGGSHTLMRDGRCEIAAQPPPPKPSRLYSTYSPDRNPYLMADEVLPCTECNQMETSLKKPKATAKHLQKSKSVQRQRRRR